MNIRVLFEIISWSMLDHQWKPEKTGRLSVPSTRILSSAYLRSRLQPETSSSARKYLNSKPLSWHLTVLTSTFNPSTILCNHLPLSFVGNGSTPEMDWTSLVMASYRNLMLKRNGRPVLPPFQCWSKIDRIMTSMKNSTNSTTLYW